MFFLNAAADEITTGDLLSSLMAIGLGVGVILVVMLLRRLTGGTSAKAPVKDNKPEPAVKIISAPAVEETENKTGFSSDDNGALIAVLTAAIIAYNKANETASSDFTEFKGLRIVSFKERNRVI